MTRKDYVLLAEVVRASVNRANRAEMSGALSANESAKVREALYDFTDDLAVELRRDNARFDKTRFFNAVVYGRQPNCWRDECRGLGQGLTTEEQRQAYVRGSLELDKVPERKEEVR
jgi:hypothetical protein